MSVEIFPATLRDICFVAGNLRPADRREITAMLPADTHLTAFAAHLFSISAPHAYIADVAGTPAGAFGATTVPGYNVGQAWAFGTNRFKRAVPAITRYMMNTLGPQLVEQGVTRVEVRSIEGHDLAHRWLTSLGARAECAMDSYGMSGETFLLYAWTADKFLMRR